MIFVLFLNPNGKRSYCVAERRKGTRTNGFKLHLVVNEVDRLLNAQLTPGNVDDRRPISDLLQGLSGKFFAARVYVSQKLANQLLEEFGIQFFAKPRRNMNNKLMRLHDMRRCILVS